MHYLGADFYLGMLELSARFDILISTAKVEVSLFALVGESITEIFIVCSKRIISIFC